MSDSPVVVRDPCSRCDATGLRRNPRHFFYGIALLASGILVFYQWPPVPWLISTFEQAATHLGLTDSVGTVTIWTLAGVPAIFGAALMYSWATRDTCPTCNGSGRDHGDREHP